MRPDRLVACVLNGVVFYGLMMSGTYERRTAYGNCAPLIDELASMKPLDEDQASLLPDLYFSAVYENDPGLISRILEEFGGEAEVDTAWDIDNGSTCFAYAAEMGHLDVAEALIQAGKVTLPAKDVLEIISGRTAFGNLVFGSGLMLALAVRDDDKRLVIEALGKASSSLGYHFGDGLVPLQVARNSSQWEIYDLIVEAQRLTIQNHM